MSAAQLFSLPRHRMTAPLVMLALLVTGCTSNPGTPSRSTPASPHLSQSSSENSETITAVDQLERLEHMTGFPTVTGIAPQDLQGIDFEHSISELPRYYARWVVFPSGFDELNQHIFDLVDNRIEDFVSTTQGYESTTEHMVNRTLPAVLPQVHISSEITGISDEAVGIRLTAATAPEQASVRRYVTEWFDVVENRNLTYEELFVDEAAWETVQSLIQDRLDSNPVVTKELTAERAWLEFFDSLNFLPDGAAVIEFDYDSVTADAEDLIEIQLPQEQITGLLSESGLRAQRSAMTPVAPRMLQDSAAEAAQQPTGLQTVSAAPAQQDAWDTATPDCSELKCVALTFDDGPSSYTGQLLDVLEAKNSRATFFVLGSSITYHPEAVHRIVFKGHEIGSHSWTHSQLTALPATVIKQSLERSSSQIRSVTGVVPVITRPPFGATNKETGLLLTTPAILWSLDSEDWLHDSPEDVADHVTENIRSGDIVLFHDVLPHTAEAVDEILDYLHANDYVPVTVSQLLAQSKPEAGVNYYSLP